MTRYDARSSSVSSPPPSRTWRTVSRASSPSYSTDAPRSAISSSVPARSGYAKRSPATRRAPSRPYIARPAERALGHPGGESRAHARVDGVPTGLQHLRARLRGQRVPRGNRPFHGEEPTFGPRRGRIAYLDCRVNVRRDKDGCEGQL